MKLNLVLLIGLVGVSGLIVAMQQRVREFETVSTVSNQAVVLANCVPTFRDGGGPYYQPNVPFRQNLAPVGSVSEKLIVSGKVLSADCSTPLQDVVLDIWQANETGSYEDEWYRGRVQVEPDGAYQFATVVPKGYGEGTGYRPPHIHFKVWQGETELVTSQMFLPAARDQQFPEENIIQISAVDGRLEGQHDIIVP